MTIASSPHTFKLGTGENPQRGFKFSDAPKRVSLDEKYRPRTLADLIGNGLAKFDLQSFAETPYSNALMFSGASGIGKTSAAFALALDLGADKWSTIEIRSGECTGEAVKDALSHLNHSAWSGSGWKFVIVNEADHMSQKAEFLWLDSLEDIRANCDRSVVIFTTNNPEKLDHRFLTRCKPIEFIPVDIIDAQTVARRVWEGERTPGDCPDVETFKGLRDRNGLISLRWVIQLLEPYIARANREPAKAKPVATPIVRTASLLSFNPKKTK